MLRFRVTSRSKLFLNHFSTIVNDIPNQARVVIIGGGIIGNSIAYHLAHMGIKDVILLEQQQLTSGTTWHAAGLMVTFGSLSETSTEIRKYSKQLYENLEKETGHSTGFKPVGFIELAADNDRLEEYRRIASFNRKHGVDVHEISAKDVLNLFPLCRTDDILGGFYVPTDGRVNPVDVTTSLSKGARMQGARIFEGVHVTGITEKIFNGKRLVTGVALQGGKTIQAEYVVNCAGMWARQLGEANGVNIPNQAAEHYYMITDAMPEVNPNWPVIEDPSSYTYIRPEGGGLMVGLFEPVAAAWNVSSIPNNFKFGEITPDWERMAPFIQKAMNRVPASLATGIKTLFCGPESFTPDLAPCIGEAPEIKNYFVAAGLNSIGILSGGGIGRVVAHWIATGRPDVDITGFNIDRLHKYQSNPDYRSQRVVETLGNVYKCHYPYKTPQTARGAKRTAVYDRVKAAGAYFRAVSGFETADWYDLPAASPSDIKAQEAIQAKHLKYTWNRPSFFDSWAYEHKACREGVVLIDMSFMSKFLVQGRDAGKCLNRLCTANIDGPVNMMTYTQCLNDQGYMEADITVSKQSWDQYMVIATDTMHRHVETLLRRNLDVNGDRHVVVTDVTGAYTQLNIQGPKSRELMQAITDTDMSNEGFPFRSAREIAIGLARVMVARITYVGELGYELHIPSEFAIHVYEKVVEVGRRYDLVHCGLKALSSLRMEKAYRDYGHDMDNLDTLHEVGLAFTADLEKGNFIGRETVIRQGEELKAKKGLPRRLVQVLLQDRLPMMYHGELLWRNDQCVGEVRAASYGHTLGGSVGLAMIEPKDSSVLVNKSYLDEGVWQVEVAGTKYAAKVSLTPMYDPKNSRIRV